MITTFLPALSKDWTTSYSTNATLIAEVDSDIYDNVALARRELADASTALSTLGSAIGEQVLVPACGTGRHVLVLAEQGHSVYAFDQSTEFLRRALNRTRSVEPKPLYKRWNMAKPFPYEGYFHTCLLLGGSFGYHDDRTNAQTLRALRSSLRIGGSLVLDVTNPDHARAMAQNRPYTSVYVDTPTFGRILDERERRWIEAEHCMVSRKRHVQVETGAVLLDLEYRIKIYEQEQLRVWLHDAGFSGTTVQNATSDHDQAMGLMAGRWVIAATG